jgi:hypothetical protein
MNSRDWPPHQIDKFVVWNRPKLRRGHLGKKLRKRKPKEGTEESPQKKRGSGWRLKLTFTSEPQNVYPKMLIYQSRTDEVRLQSEYWGLLGVGVAEAMGSENLCLLIRTVPVKLRVINMAAPIAARGLRREARM